MKKKKKHPLVIEARPGAGEQFAGEQFAGESLQESGKFSESAFVRSAASELTLSFPKAQEAIMPKHKATDKITVM